MSAEHPSLTDAEIHLRVAAPIFFEDLIGSHTETLIEQQNPETFIAWKEIRQQVDGQFASLPAERLFQIAQEQQAKPFDAQCHELGEALKQFAAQVEIPLERHLASPNQVAASCANILREERELDLSFESAVNQVPSADARFAANREIDQSRARYRELTEPVRNEFKEMSQAARDEFLAEQRKIGKEALEAQSQSLQQSVSLEIDPPEHER